MSEICWESARKGDKDEIDKIVTTYYKVAYKIAHSWANTGQIEASEAVGLSNIAIMKCITKGTYDETRGIKFSSYLGSAVHNEIRMFLRKDRRIRDRNIMSLDQDSTADRTRPSGGSMSVDNLTVRDSLLMTESLEDSLEDQYLLEEALQVLDATIDHLSSIELKCLSLHLSGLSVKEISKEVGFSQSYSRKILNIAQEKLREQHTMRNGVN